MVTLFQRGKKYKILYILTFIVIGLLTYFSSLHNQFVWDDDHFFYQNIFTQSLTHIKEIFLANTTAGAGQTSNYYRPITTLSFALDHALWGWNPVGLHLTNTLFHIANTILLFLLLTRLGMNKTMSFVLGLLFLVHPIQTEAVTYLSSRGDIFYTFFLLSSVYIFTLLLYKTSLTITILGNRVIFSQNRAFFICILLFLFSIFSKEAALTTVPMYPAVLFMFALKRGLSVQKLHSNHRHHFLVVLILILLTIIYFGLRLTVLNFANSLNYNGEQNYYSSHLAVRLYTFLHTIPIYIRLLIFPYPLYLERTSSVITTVFHPSVIVTLGIIFSTLFLAIWELRGKRSGWVLFGMTLIFANLLSVSGIIPMTALIRENWLYLPMVGFYIIIFSIAEIAFPKWIKKHRKLLLGCFVCLCMIFITMTIMQNYNWRDRIAYLEHNLRFTDTARLHLNLGNAYEARGDYDRALRHLHQAITIADIYPQTHYNLANIYLQQGKADEAEKELLISLQMDPNYLYAYPILIQIYENNSQFTKTLPFLKRLSAIYPNDIKITIMYADDLYRSGNIHEANVEFGKALVLSHNDPKLVEAIEITKKNGQISK